MVDFILPKQLHTPLECLLKGHIMSTWNIHGNDKFTTATFRFNMVDSTDNDEANVKYKFVSERQRQRNIQRASQCNKSEDTVDDTNRCDRPLEKDIVVNKKAVSNMKTNTPKLSLVNIERYGSSITTCSKKVKLTIGLKTVRGLGQCKLNIDEQAYTSLPPVDGQNDPFPIAKPDLHTTNNDPGHMKACERLR